MAETYDFDSPWAITRDVTTYPAHDGSYSIGIENAYSYARLPTPHRTRTNLAYLVISRRCRIDYAYLGDGFIFILRKSEDGSMM